MPLITQSLDHLSGLFYCCRKSFATNIYRLSLRHELKPQLRMTLYQKLQQAKSEEDVKDAYIKALGLKNYSKDLIDIRTK